MDPRDPVPGAFDRPLPSGPRMGREGNVALLAIHSNALDADPDRVCHELIGALREVEEDNTLTAAILLSDNDGVADDVVANTAGMPVDDALRTAVEAIERCSKPVVAAIEGTTRGLGFELALGCDARVALAGAIVGMPGTASGMQRVAVLVGAAAAIDIVGSGRDIGAMEAVGLGLIDAVVEGDLIAGAVAYAVACGNAGRKRRLSEARPPSDKA